MLESNGGWNDWGLEIDYLIANLMLFLYWLLVSCDYLLILTVILFRLPNSDSQIVVSSR